jgi:predicted transposase/invertase (TIGR01784 family)
VPTFVEIERIRKDALKLGEKRGRKDGGKEGEKSDAKKMAKKMKQKGYDMMEILGLTGLSKEEIEEL